MDYCNLKNYNEGFIHRRKIYYQLNTNIKDGDLLDASLITEKTLILAPYLFQYNFLFSFM